jgi:hypothetical protein
MPEIDKNAKEVVIDIELVCRSKHLGKLPLFESHDESR